MNPLWFSILPAYFIGGIPFGYLIGRSQGIDIREHGSGNIGATNVVRVLGKKLGYSCFLCDFAKGALPVIIVRSVWPEGPTALPAALALATVLGHVFSPYLKLQGGKGVATATGALIAVAPYPLLGALTVWILAYFSTRVVAIASIAAAIALPIACYAGQIANLFTTSKPTQILLIAISLMIVVRHRTNIQRLIAGSEHGFNKENS